MPTALVTGASRGIGGAVARRLARDGFDVAVHYHQDADGAEATRAAVEAMGRRAVVLQADLADPEAAWKISEAAAEALGGMDCFVANAGVYDRRAFRDMTGEAWRRTMAVDLDAPALMTQALLPHLEANPERAGCVVFVGSVVAARGSTHGAHYTAAKAGLEGLTRALARELAPRVRVNTVAPGYVDTDLLSGDSPERRRSRAAEVPLGRVGDPDDVAGVVSFLVGPDADYITGQTLAVNGGLRL